MRDLRSEMYASSINDQENDNLRSSNDFDYVTRAEFNRKIKELEAKIRLLESKIGGIDGWSIK